MKSRIVFILYFAFDVYRENLVKYCKMPHNRKLTKEKRVKKKHQFVLILGIINVILPVIPVLSHRGWFGMVENGWKFIWVAAIMILLPFVSSLAGIIIGSIQLKKASTKPVKMGLLLSCTGLVMHLLFRFVFKL